MTRILALAGLLAAQIIIGHCAEDDIVITKPFIVGSIMRLEGPTAAIGSPSSPTTIECSVTTNQNITYKLFPTDESPGWYDGRGSKCSIDIRDVPLSYAGFWTIETRINFIKLKTKFLARFRQDNMVKPTINIDSAEGQFATLWLDNMDRDDLKECSLTNPKWDNIDLINAQLNEDMTRVKGCGVRMKVSKNTTGQWEFKAAYGENGEFVTSGIFHINVPYENPNENKMIHTSWDIGRPAKLDFWLGGALFCQLTRPDGVKLPLIFGSCAYNIPSVSLRHRGIWTASYAKSDKLELMSVKINVTTKDPDLLEGSVSQVDNKINLMCRSGMKSMKFCTFIRPDKVIINVPAGVGNEKYSYYGNGYQERYSSSRLYSECGLTIENPSAEDFGLWTCEMSIDGSIRGTVINVVEFQAVKGSKIDNPNVFVKRGDEFKVRCSTNALLSYCWLTSPNGTAYTVSSGKEEGTLKYDGRGLTMGECGAIVKNANDSDNGDWTCHLGIKNETSEVEATVAVKVTDTYLIATENTVYARSNPKLSCHTFSGEDGTLRYCRWVRPDGHGINKEDASRYNLQQGMNECSLTILALEPEDIGQWQCIASLSRTSNTEEWAAIELQAVSEDTKIASILMIVFGSALLVIALIGASFVAMYIYKKRNARIMKSPPPYYPEDYIVPDGIQTSPDPNIKDKNYVY